jgi:hypothetical protein
MSILWSILFKLVTMFLKGDIDVEVEPTGEEHHGNPNTRKRLVEFIRMHYKNSHDHSSASNATNFKRDD